MKKVLTKNEVKNVVKIETRRLEFDELDYDLIIRNLNADAVLKLQKYIENDKPTPEYFFHLIVLSVIDDEMLPVFTLEDAKNLPPNVLNKLLIDISELNGLDKEAVEKAKQELFLAKNSDLLTDSASN